MQLPWAWVALLALGWLAIAAFILIGSRFDAGPFSGAGDRAATT